MIPKTIHYIWLSNNKMNGVAKSCIRSWKKYAKGFTTKKCTLSDFDMASLPLFVKEAIEKKKWAFACDYLRLYILNKEGGIYLDSDVLMLSNPAEFLDNEFFSSVEYYEDLFMKDRAFVDDDGHTDKSMVMGMALQAAVMGSVPGHPFVKACMEYYTDRPFVLSDGELSTQMLAPHIYAMQAVPFGYRYCNEEQFLKDGIHLYKSEVFAPGFDEANESSKMIHLCNGSWRDDSLRNRLKLSIQKKLQILRSSGF